MPDFLPITLNRREQLHPLLYAAGRKGCEYSFANLLLWLGDFSELALIGDFVCVRMKTKEGARYFFPAGAGDPEAAIETLRRDADARGERFCMVGVTNEDRAYLEERFPDRFSFQPCRDSFDYLYPVEQLAELSGKKLQAKRNHINRFLSEHPDWRTEPISEKNTALCARCAQKWFLTHSDRGGEREHRILSFALANFRALRMEGLILLADGEPLAFSMGGRITPEIFDVNFEKADAEVSGTFAMINREMARMVRGRYPDVRLLNREDDMGLPGLRKAKESYHPLLLEKYAATWEDT